MRRRALGTVAVVAGLLLGGCGSDSSSNGGKAASTTAAAVTTGGGTAASGDPAACAVGNTLTDGKLVVATGNPAFPPYVIDDDPASGKGFESAVAYAVADEMGFAHDAVSWVRTGFDEAVQPGPKNFDMNIQQYSINDERKQVVGFSEPYYTSSQAIFGYADSPAAKVDNVEGFAALRLGAAVGTTSLDYINDVIKPKSAALVFNDNAAAKAALDAKQVDAIVSDLPTALYITSAEIEGTVVYGQFPVDDKFPGDNFGILMAKDSPLIPCVDAALDALKSSGELQRITTEWMADYTKAPVIGFG